MSYSFTNYKTIRTFLIRTYIYCSPVDPIYIENKMFENPRFSHTHMDSPLITLYTAILIRQFGR